MSAARIVPVFGIYLALVGLTLSVIGVEKTWRIGSY